MNELLRSELHDGSEQTRCLVLCGMFCFLVWLQTCTPWSFIRLISSHTCTHTDWIPANRHARQDKETHKAPAADPSHLLSLRMVGGANQPPAALHEAPGQRRTQGQSQQEPCRPRRTRVNRTSAEHHSYNILTVPCEGKSENHFPKHQSCCFSRTSSSFQC